MCIWCVIIDLLAKLILVVPGTFVVVYFIDSLTRREK